MTTQQFDNKLSAMTEDVKCTKGPGSWSKRFVLSQRPRQSVIHFDIFDTSGACNLYRILRENGLYANTLQSRVLLHICTDSDRKDLVPVPWPQNQWKLIPPNVSIGKQKRAIFCQLISDDSWWILHLVVFRSISSIEQPLSVRHTKAFEIACTQQNVSDLAGVAFSSRCKKVLQETQNVSQASLEGPLSCIQCMFSRVWSLNLEGTTESGFRMKMGSETQAWTRPNRDGKWNTHSFSIAFCVLTEFWQNSVRICWTGLLGA